MLSLTRKRDEIITIGEHIEVKVVSIHREHVKLGIVAPREVTIHRKEVQEKLKLQQKG